jgi:hypothetical protein
VAQYEHLRTVALSRAPDHPPAPGLLLLRRQGMIAWLRAGVPARPRGADPAPPAPAAGAAALPTQLATILAEILLAQDREAVRC